MSRTRRGDRREAGTSLFWAFTPTDSRFVQVLRSLEHAIRAHKRAHWRAAAWVAALALLLAACTSAADIRAAQEASWQDLQYEGDRLFAALERTADEREIPVARSDPAARRLTSEWIYALEPDRPELRRRYFMTVFVHPQAGLALHARIDREAPTGNGVDGPIFESVGPDEAVRAEQDALVQRAYEIYQRD